MPDQRTPAEQVDAAVNLVNHAYAHMFEFGPPDEPGAGTPAVEEARSQGHASFMYAVQVLTDLVRERGHEGTKAMFTVIRHLSDQEDSGPLRWLAAQAFTELATTDWAMPEADDDEDD